MLGAKKTVPVEVPDGRLHRAPGKPRLAGDSLVADADAPGPPVAGSGAAEEEEIDHEGGWRLVVPHQVAHQGVEDVLVENYLLYRYSAAHCSISS
jgi:hypothetical protein